MEAKPNVHEDPLAAFKAVLEKNGLRPDIVTGDDNLHRCGTDGKEHGKDGAYVLHLDDPASGWWQNFRTGETGKWTCRSLKEMSAKEKSRLFARIVEDRRVRQAEQELRHAEAADEANEMLDMARDCPHDHAYLEGKGVVPAPGMKIAHDGRLLIPIFDEADKVISLQRIGMDGEKYFLSGGRTKGGFFQIAGNEDLICICEGYATGATVHEATGATVFVAFNCGNLKAVAQTARERHPDSDILVCGDDDHGTEGNPGRSRAEEAACAIAGWVILPQFNDPQGRSDFNDMAQEQGHASVRDLILSYTHKGARGGNDGVPHPFSLRSTGVHYLVEGQDGELRTERVCSRLRVLAMTRNHEGEEWGRLVEVIDADNVAHTWAMPATMLAGSGEALRAELLRMGLEIDSGSKSRTRLAMYLMEAKPQRRVRCVGRPGWHQGNYVMPDAVYGPEGLDEICLQAEVRENPFAVKGSLDDWRVAVGEIVRGNSRLVFGVSAALAAPLLDLVGQESGGFHLVGGSSTGKTTCLQVAASVAGGCGVRGGLKQWRTTDNALESVAVLHCDAPLFLDEVGQATPRVVAEAAYMLANGQGKGRANKNGVAGKVHEWRVLFMSSGEVGLVDKIEEDPMLKAMAGQRVRLVDIPIDAGAGYGAFEDLHGASDGDEFARRLKEASTAFYGTPYRAFVQALADDRDGSTAMIRELMAEFVVENCPKGVDGQVSRVCQRFALVAAAGEFARQMGIIPMEAGEAGRAVANCFRAWLERRGGEGAVEIQVGIARVRAFIETHGASRFQALGDVTGQRVQQRAGFWREKGDEKQYLFFGKVFREEVCKGMDHTTIARALEKAGWLECESGRLTKKIRTPDGQTYLYVVSASILGEIAETGGNSLGNEG